MTSSCFCSPWPTQLGVRCGLPVSRNVSGNPTSVECRTEREEGGEEERERVELCVVSPALLLDVFRVQGGRAAEQRHFTGSHLYIQGSMCVNEGLDQLCGGPHLLLHHRKKNTQQNFYCYLNGQILRLVKAAMNNRLSGLYKNTSDH